MYYIIFFSPWVVRGIKYEMVSREIYCWHIRHPYCMNAQCPPIIPSVSTATLYIKYTRHYKFISAILPELICSLGIARSSISSQRTFRTDLLSTGRRRRVQTLQLLLYAHICIYTLYPRSHSSTLSPCRSSRLNLF